MANLDALRSAVSATLNAPDASPSGAIAHDLTVGEREIEVQVASDDMVATARRLRDDSACRFEQLIDLCGVDYGAYGREETTLTTDELNQTQRYAVVYQLLSVTNNHRLRLKSFVSSEFPVIDSVTGVWPAADWFEREAFDLFGIVFEGHPDLRRLLTDYGFIGHPFRKDFPLSGHVEMRYDAEKGRVIYEPVSIDPRVLVPRTIRPETFSD